MSDLVQRLRALVILDEMRSDNPLGREAAAHIEALEATLREIVRMLVYGREAAARIKALEVALREIAEKSNDLFARNIARLAVEQEEDE